MSNMTAVRPGSNNGGGDKLELYLKMFSGEVLMQFHNRTIFRSRHSVRTIASGKSAQHIVTGIGTASYHTVGTELVGTGLLASERTISIDDQLVADRFLANFDEAMSQYDMRSPLSRDIGYALANQFDKNVAQTLCLSARASATVTGGSGGGNSSHADNDTSGDQIVAAIFDAAENFDTKNVPEDGRVVALRPEQYYLIVNAAKVTNQDYTTSVNGGVDTGRIIRVAGLEIVKSNNVPAANIATGPAAYQGDFSKTYGIAWHREAAGTTMLKDLQVESDYLIRNQGTLLVGKYLLGHGILRPECAFEIVVP